MRRALSEGLRKAVSQKQARYLQMFGDGDVEAVGRLIDAKGGDFYKLDLYPKKDVVKQAEADFESYRTGTPAMEEIARDMRNYYGLPRQMGDLSGGYTVPDHLKKALPTSSPNPAPVPITSPAPVNGPMQGPAEAFKEKKIREVKEQMNLVDERPMVEQVTDDLVEQQQVASAEQLRQDYVDQLENGVQRQIDQALEDLKPKGFVLDDPYADALMWTGMGLMAGGGAVSALSGKSEDDEMIEKAKELGLIT